MSNMPTGLHSKPPEIRKPALREALAIDIPPIEIYDIGAMIEGADRYASLLEQGLAHVTGFEPNPAEFARLQGQYDLRKSFHPYFIGDGTPATFHRTRAPACSSLYEPDPAVIDLFTAMGATLPEGNFAVVEKTQVQTRCLDDIPGLPPCDYLKIDVQGAELDVLRGGPAALAHASVVEVEVEFIPLYKRQPLFAEVQLFMQQHHFVLHKFIDLGGRAFKPLQISSNPFASMSQLLWADAIFVRDFAYPDHYTNDQFLKTAAILYDVYCSHDLAYLLLAAYDKRHNTELAPHFRRILGNMPAIPVAFLTQKTWIE
jgi:FkbM family methyltransferase